MRSPFRLIAGIALFLAAAASAAGDLVVVVSARNPTDALRPDQVAAIFLGQSASFPDGAQARPLDQPMGSALHEQFYLRVTGKSAAMLKAYWSKMVFTGRGQPPRDARDSIAVRRAVADDPSLIGYIDREALDPTVRPVLLVH